MPAIVLAALNAKWIHASFGLRCLRANLGDLRPDSTIVEFDQKARAVDVAERILALRPRIVGIGVYVWNAAQAELLVDALKRIAPEVVVVLGGPEVSHETQAQPMCEQADYVIRGEGDLAFAALCRDLLAGVRPTVRWIDARPPHLEELASPYGEYTDQDIAHRIVYVEASRGCPFTCEFCLSALDEKVRKAPLAPFLAEMQRLYDRGLRHFKFVDRTFNLDVRTATAILEFFLARCGPDLFVHFELIPDRLPEDLKAVIARFPQGALQFEVGVQTLDDAVGRTIARRQDVARIAQNLRWLRDHTGVHLHADLIVGLPGEDLATFGRGFDRLWAMGPHEIQVGILKRLRGAPIARHDQSHGMVYAGAPPYEVLRTAAMPFADVQRLKRFARYWDLVANSGNWPHALALLLSGESAFAGFLAFADWLHEETGATHGIAMHRLAELLFRHLTGPRGCEPDEAGAALAADYAHGRRHDWPELLRPWAGPRRAHQRHDEAGQDRNPAAARQARHRAT